MIVGAPLSKLDQMAQICATMRAAAALGREAWVAGASAGGGGAPSTLLLCPFDLDYLCGEKSTGVP